MIMAQTLSRNFDFMALRKPAVVLSAVLLMISVVSLFTLKLNVGIDFTGGSIIEVGYQQAVELEPIRAALESQGFGDAIVQHFGSASEVLIRLVPDAEKEKQDDSSVSVEDTPVAREQEEANLGDHPILGPVVADFSKSTLHMMVGLNDLLIIPTILGLLFFCHPVE